MTFPVVKEARIMPRWVKLFATAFVICLFLFALMRIGTSVYENLIRSIGGVPYSRESKTSPVDFTPPGLFF